MTGQKQPALAIQTTPRDRDKTAKNAAPTHRFMADRRNQGRKPCDADGWLGREILKKKRAVEATRLWRSAA